MKQENQVSISLVTTCKGRLTYLKESIQTWINLDYDNYDIIIVDYDCPDGTNDYITGIKPSLLLSNRIKDITVLKVNNKPFFNLNDARNKGIDHSNSELIFMIDSDISIKDKSVLKLINTDYKNGVVFFSNHQILNSKYSESFKLYQLQKMISNDLNKAMLLLAGIFVPGTSGTSCFTKQIYNLCGKFKPEINKNGFGWDEFEFYLYYINFYFYQIFLKYKTTRFMTLSKALDQVLFNFKLFNNKTFISADNLIEEKDRFYPMPMDDSREKNKSFLSNFFLKTIIEISEGKSELLKLNCTSVFKYKREKQIPLASWYKSWFYQWYGIELFRAGFYEKSKHYLEKLNELRETSALDEYRLGSLEKKLKNYSKSKKRFKKVLANSKDKVLLANVFFHLGEIEYKNNKKKANYYFKESLHLNPNQKKSQEYLKRNIKIF